MNIFTTLPKAQDADKQLLFTVIKYCCSMAEKARREGILALEEGLPALAAEPGEHITVVGGAQPFASFPAVERCIVWLLRLVIDGCDTGFLADCARYALAASDEADGTNLACMLAAEGIAAIQRGENPELIRQKLAAMLGLRLCADFIAETDEQPFLLEFLSFPPLPDEAEWNRTHATEFARLEAERGGGLPFSAIARVDDCGIQKLLREVDSDELVHALTPPSAAPVCETVFRNLSEQAAKMLRYDIATRYPCTAEVIFESQRKIISTLTRLIEAGAIALVKEEGND